MQDRIAYQGITFDDVLLEPAYSDVVPRDVDVRTQLTQNIRLNIPIISSPMDTVTTADLATRTEHFDLQIEETQLATGSALVGQTLKDSQVRERFGVMIVAIKKPSGHMVYNPPGEAQLEAGDILIALGHRRQLDELERVASG